MFGFIIFLVITIFILLVLGIIFLALHIKNNKIIKTAIVLNNNDFRQGETISIQLQLLPDIDVNIEKIEARLYCIQNYFDPENNFNPETFALLADKIINFFERLWKPKNAKVNLLGLNDTTLSESLLKLANNIELKAGKTIIVEGEMPITYDSVPSDFSGKLTTRWVLSLIIYHEKGLLHLPKDIIVYSGYARPEMIKLPKTSNDTISPKNKDQSIFIRKDAPTQSDEKDTFSHLEFD